MKIGQREKDNSAESQKSTPQTNIQGASNTTTTNVHEQMENFRIANFVQQPFTAPPTTSGKVSKKISAVMVDNIDPKHLTPWLSQSISNLQTQSQLDSRPLEQIQEEAAKFQPNLLQMNQQTQLEGDKDSDDPQQSDANMDGDHQAHNGQNQSASEKNDDLDKNGN